MSKNKSQTITDQISQALKHSNTTLLIHLLHGLSSGEIAEILDFTPPEQRFTLWHALSNEQQAKVLNQLSEEVQTLLLEDIPPEEFVDLTEHLDTDDLVDIIQTLEPEQQQTYIEVLDETQQETIQQLLQYPPDTAGGLMNPDFVSLRPDITLDVAVRYIRQVKLDFSQRSYFYVTNRQGEYLGTLPLLSLLTYDGDCHVTDIMESHIPAIDALLSDSDTVTLFEEHDLNAAPVINHLGQVVGEITIDDIVDLIRDEAEKNMLSQVGLNDENDIFAPVRVHVKRRSLWLGINLLTAFLAAWVIGLFGATIEQVVALAILMPVVASMGGIAGSQTLTIVIRALAVGKISTSSIISLSFKEFWVGMTNGIIWALVIAGITYLWFHDGLLAAIIASAIVINLIFAALSGATIPLILNRLHIDPALAGGVILTTVTDVVGFLSFLGLASWLLL